MKISEVRSKSKKELEKIVRDNRERLRSLKFDLVSGKVKNVREIRQIKKDTAQALTIIKEK